MEPTKGQYPRYKSIFKDQPMPFAFVDLENFDRNVRYVAKTQEKTGKSIRVHTKSLRCVELTKRIFEIGGSQFKGLMTFTMEETAWLATQGFDDFIVAYPTVQPSDIQLFCELTKKGVRVSLMVDSADHLKIFSEAGQKSCVTLRLCLDLDLAYRPLNSSIHLGMRRSPIRTVEDALSLVRVAKDLPALRINSVMGYEGHIAGLSDNQPGQWLKNKTMAALKFASIRELTKRRVDIADRLRSEGIDLEIVNGGGSGSLRSTGQDPSVTEVTAGSAFFASGMFWHYKDVSFLPSAFFAIQVVRKPASDMVTCLGGGYIASGGVGPDKQPVPVYPEGMTLTSLEGAGEVQTPLILPKDAPLLNVGDPVFFQHAKAGELCERFNLLHLVQADKIVGKAKTYRGEGKSFL